MSEINIIIGGISSGKTTKCLDIIGKIKSDNPESQIIIIVPEQHSYAAEKMTADRFGGTGLNGIEVLTFSRMAKRYLPRAVKNYLTPSGKAVLITKAAENACSENSIYKDSAKKPGFAGNIMSMISELKRFMITPDMIKYSANHLDDSILKQKLTAISEIYTEYEQLNNNRFLDSDDDLMRFAEKIMTDNLFKGYSIFIDEFSDFLPQHYKIIEALSQKSEKMYVTLPLSDTFPTVLSEIPADTYNKIKRLSEKLNISFSETKLSKEGLGFKSEEISFLYNSYSRAYKKDFSPYPEKTKDITVFSGRDAYSETEYAARKINALVCEKNYNFSDITIVCGGLENYSELIEAVFSEYKIPYFTDSKLSVVNHPILITVLGVFDILTSNWSFDSVFSYLKSGFVYQKENDNTVPVNADDIDYLSSYVLKYGIRGKSKWLSETDWQIRFSGLSENVSSDRIKSDPEAEERLNRIRKAVTSPIAEFAENIKGRNTVRHFASALYDFLCDIHLYDGLESEIEKLNCSGMRNEAEQISQVWNILINAINQTAVTLGDEKCLKDDYRNYLLAALGECNISIIPSSLNSVTVTGADSTVQGSSRAVFILGAVRGEIPHELSGSEFLSEAERERFSLLLKDENLDISFSASRKSTEEYRFLRLLFNAHEKISISYPVNSFEGEALIPSQLIQDLEKLFPKLTASNDLLGEVITAEEILSPKYAFDYLMQNRRNIKDNTAARIYSLFSENPELRDKLKIIETADNYKRTAAKITPENAAELYRQRAAYSVSRLNEFSGCPFKYYAKYGLKAKDEEIWQIQKFDLGSLMHYAVWRFCHAVEGASDSFDALKANWQSMTDENCDELIEQIMAEMKDKISAFLERDQNKMNYLLARMTKTLKRAANTIKKSISLGGYAPVGYEKQFLFQPEPDICDLLLKGTIDRVDACFDSASKIADLRIIDYKSGSKEFSIASICNMIDIQLIVYAMAAVSLYNKGELEYSKGDFSAKISGILYNKLRDDRAKITSDSNTDSVNAAVNDTMKLNGAVILDETDGKSNIEALFGMDSTLKTQTQSEFLNIKLLKNGNPSKTSDYLTREQFNKLIAYAKKGIKSYHKRILGGDIKIMPGKNKNELNCRWCEMSEICLFDSEHDPVRKLCTNNEKAWEIIDEEISKR